MHELSYLGWTARGWIEELSFRPPSEGTRLWLVDLHSIEPSLYALADLLSRSEQERAARFLVEPARRQFLASHAALRLILGDQLGVEPRLLGFRATKKGKPQLTGPCASACHFNLSHAGTYALVGVAQDCEIGVDIEQHQAPEKVTELAPLCFTEIERQILKRATGSGAGHEAFARLWTRKEAILKACGEGIGTDLLSIDVSGGARADCAQTTPVIFAGRQFQLWSLPAPDGYEAACSLVHTLEESVDL